MEGVIRKLWQIALWILIYFTGRLDTIGSKFKQNKTIMKQCREEVNLFRITGWDKMDKTIERVF